MCYLPAYSPEPNPVEYIFGYIKGRLRNERDSSRPFIDDLSHILSGLNGELIQNFYSKCIFDPKIG
jgi:transposase